MNPIHTPNPYQFIDLTLYLLCMGSFYLCFKLQNKLKGQGLMQLYQLSILIDLGIIILSLLLEPNLVSKIFFNAISYLHTAIFSTIGILFGFSYVYFEKWIYKSKHNISSKPNYFIVTIVVILACLEEILFRGIANSASISMGGHFTYCFIFFSTLFFGACHLFAGWLQFFSKTILSCFFLIFYLLSGSILAPILSHVAFNYFVIKKFPLDESAECK